MEQNVCEMMAAGIQSKQLAIEHVRNRRKRMPVSANDVRKCPTDSVNAQTPRNLGILVDVIRIVEINERKARGLSKYKPRDRDEDETNDDQCPPPQPSVILSEAKRSRRIPLHYLSIS